MSVTEIRYYKLFVKFVQVGHTQGLRTLRCMMKITSTLFNLVENEAGFLDFAFMVITRVVLSLFDTPVI